MALIGGSWRFVKVSAPLRSAEFWFSFLEKCPQAFFKVFRIPAWIVLIYWFGLQVLTAYTAQVNPEVSNGVAVWAHVGGFVAGMVLIKLFENPQLVAERNAWRNERELAAQPG